ncbi:hypothetical protein HDZ31DRAFT_68628 [Schizophyllum fasciatum]
MSGPSSLNWDIILKGGLSGMHFGVSAEHVNRDERGYIDFEKMIGLDVTVLISIVGDADEATLTGRKALQSRITHNDGGTWKPLNTLPVESFGNKYECQSTQYSCALHIHGYTERLDPRAMYSSPSIVGLLMAVGNVDEHLLPYMESETFLSRDAGLTWEEDHKGSAHYLYAKGGKLRVSHIQRQAPSLVL